MKSKNNIVLVLFAVFAFAAMGVNQVFAATATLTAATGGSAISADNVASGTWTTLTGPITAETAAGQIGTGTIILTAPSGFQFNTSAGTTVMVTGGATAANNINGLASGSTIAATVASSTITITISSKSVGNLNTLTWQNIQVQPTAGTPLASGTLARSGTAANLASGNWGTLTEVAGAAANLAFTAQPVGGTYGVALTTQPVVKSQDQFGNNSTSGLGSTVTVSLALTTGNGSLVGTTSLNIGTAGGNGTATFTALKVNAAGTGDIMTASATGLNSANSAAFNIAQANLTVSGITAASRVYDGTTVATLNVGSAALVGIVSGDSVTLNTGSATGAFATKTVANGKSVTVSGLSISGASAANYTLTAPVPTANITKATLTVSGITANSKVYDGGTTAALSTGGAALVGLASGDAVTLNTGSAAGTFASATVGTGKTVTVSGLTITGTDSANYNLTQPTTTANITVATLTVTATGVNKVYTATTNATVTLSDNRVSGDAVTITYSASFADKNVANGKPVSVVNITITGGSDSANYTLGNTNALTTANITAKALTVTATAANKVYDGTTAASVTLTDNRISGDSLTVNYTSATFSSATVGNSKTVTVSGITLSGTDGGNYSVASTATDTANITAKALTVSGVTASNKVYNGNTTATVSTNGASLVGVIGGDTVNMSGTAAGVFADKNVGTGKTVTISGITLAGASAANYTVTQPTTTADITVATLTVNATGVNKVYDGTTNTTVTLSDNHIGSDSVTTTYGSAGFADKNVANGKPVSVSGIAITGGTAAGNYTLGNTTASATANITAKTLTVTATAANKVYDGTNAATVTLTDNRVSGDSLTVNYTAATFSSAAVGNNKTVTVSGITLSGTDGGNYSVASTATDTANITAKGLTVSGVTASNKVYNGNTTATVVTNGASLVGVVSGDTVNMSGTATGVFADKNVGTGKTVTISGITLAGASAANYTVTQPTTTADITTATLTVSATGVNRVYDGTTNTTVTLSDNHIGSDVVTTAYGTAGFADKNVANGKPVSVSGIAITGGAGASNYTLGNTNASATANITAKSLTVTATADNKVYDKTTTATVTLADNRVSGDSLTANNTSATFASATVGNNKTVTVSGISISGTDAGNYTLSSTTATDSANITAKALTVSGMTASNKVYNATTTATVSISGASLVGVVSGDTVTLGGTTAGVFSDKNVGTGKTVTSTGLTISGASAANYTLTQGTAPADITAATLTVTATGVNRTYNGTTNATVTLADNHIGSDVVTTTYGGAGFADKNAANGKAVSVSGIAISGGTDAGNYNLGNTTAATTANITKATLAVTATGIDKIYDKTTAASVTLNDNRVSGDSLTISSTSATFATAGIGTGKTVTVSGISATGTDSGNYTANTSTTTTASITAKPLTVSGVTASNKTYNGNVSATVNSAGATPVGVVSGDTVTLGGTAAGVFADKNVGAGKTVTISGMTIGGSGAANYTLTQPTATASITAASLTVTATGVNKAYDATAAASVTLSATPIGSDNVGATYTSAAFSDKNVGTGKTVNVSGISLAGPDGGNYTPNATATTIADITAAFLTVSATGINKVYDGTTAATVTPSDDRISGDSFTVNYSAAFADKNVGIGKSVSVTGISITGGDAGNYQLTSTSATASAAITPVTLTVTAQDASRFTVDPNPAFTVSYSGFVNGEVLATSDVTGAPDISTTATSGSSAGTYPIIPSVGTLASTNYEFAFANGTLTVTEAANMAFFDDFSRPTDPGDLAPWIQQSGNWSVTGGALNGGPNAVGHYGVVYYDTNWVDYSVEAQMQFPEGAYGGGIGGRVDATTGARYSAWIYPEGSSGGSSILKLIKFQTWSTFSYTNTNYATMAEASLPGVGTNQHNLKLAFHGNQITVSYDGSEMISASDIEASPYTHGGISVDMWTDGTGYVMLVDNVKVFQSMADQTITFGSLANATYGDAPFDMTATASSGLPVSLSIIAGPATIVSNTVTITGAGSVTVRASQPGDSNYNSATNVDQSFTVNPAAITITADAQAKTYGDADPELTSQITSGALVGSDTLSGNITRVAGENVGGYAIQQGTLDAGTNYALTFLPANLTISQKAITITADAKSKTYGDVDPALTSQITSGALVGSDTLSGAIGRVAGENVGAYAIQQGTLSAGANYDLTFVPANLTIGQKAITVTADSESKMYGDADPALTSQITSGALVGSDALSGSLSRVAGENAGSYAIQQGSLTAGANYNLTFVPANLTIAPKPLLVQADDKSRGYGASNPELTISYTGFITNESVANLAELPQASTLADTNSPIGNYEITLTGGSDTNYSLVLSNGTLTVTLAAITVTADAQSKTYGDADPALSYQITSGALLNGDSLAGSLTRDAGETIGAYAIQQGTLAASTNYTVTFAGANLTIGQKAITVTADAKSKTYGDVDPALTSQITSGALVGSDTMSGGITRVAGENVGGYAIQQGTLDAGTNYSLMFIPANLTIGQKPITITADAKSKTYGDIDPALTSQITSGALVGSDMLSGNISRVVGENAGIYAIQQGTLSAGANYDLTFVPADLTIGQKAITVTADAKSKTYGDADPALTSQITSGALVGSDALSGGLSRMAGENAGSYAIQQGSLSAGANYNLIFVPASLTIAPKPLLVQADDKSRGYGASNPELTISYSGFITNESMANLAELPQASTLADTNSPIGNYEITLTGGSDTNYSLVLSNGTLTVTLAAITVTADAQSKTYGDADPALSYQITSGALLNGDSLTGSLSRPAGETIGTYAIQQGTLAANTNYTLTFIGTDLTISPKAITVTADAKSKIYGDADPALTSQITSGALVGSDTMSGGITRVAGENVGDYAIQQGTLDAGTNYSLMFIPANLTIAPKPITVTADAQTKTYGDADPVLTSQITSGALVGSDMLSGSISRVAGENAGMYAIQQGTLNAGANYDLSFVGANLTIGQKAITVTADAKSKVYGDVDPALTSQITSGALVGSDALGGNLSRIAGENAGSYAIQQGSLSAGANYNQTFVPASLTIAPKPLLVQADDKSRGYGASNPELTVSYSGFITNESVANLAELPQASTLADTNSPIGNYEITLTGGSDTNYSLVLSNGTLTVTLAAITVTADAQSKTYGDADPALSYQITSGALLNGDSLAGSLTRDAGETIGAYAIQQGTLAASTNYTVTFAGANLTIGQKAITVTADAKSKTYGDVDPALTSQITSGALVGGDMLSGSITRVAGENVGGYAIQRGTLDAGTNYSLMFIPANLTIGQKPITITADAKSKTYGDIDPALTSQITSGALVGTDTLSGSIARVTGENAGIYAIQQGTLSAGANYDLSFVPANLTIAPANSTTTLVSSENPSASGASVTFTATVAPVAPAASTPTGSVQFFTNGVACGSAVALSGGVATLSTSELPAGTNTVTAAYSGDANFNTSGNGVSQVVNENAAAPSNIAMQNNGDGTITISFSGTPGAQYVIQAGADLGSSTSWSNVSTNTASLDGKCSFTESMAGHPVRFYRPIKP